ncbi:MAG TPA: glucose-6-phosphate dehydrogenase [Planctomycetota bacterium]|nr:glucose-6-phosphate dehydrogenase [Planctomycetota bacterium]
MNPLREGLLRQRVPEPCAMVIFGASGDLAHRKLVPAIYALAHEGLLPPFFSLIGVANGEFDRDGFRNDMREALGNFSRYKPVNETVWNALSAGMDYVKGDFDNPKTYEDLAARLQESDAQRGTKGNRLFYLSTAPSLFETIARRLKQHGIVKSPGWQRVVIEKPFGRDLASARELNQNLKKIFIEEEIYRIDHYLGKETVQNILVLRFANGLFEPVWRNQFIDHVQITVAETLGIGYRSGYYEEAGAARDMMQNHMMQLLALIAMEPPISLAAEQIRNEKVKVLEALRRMKDEEVGVQTVRGQYGRGYVGGAPVKGYREETGVNPQSKTETFGCMKLFIDSWRWSGVPFYLRHGKRLPKSGTEISLFFRNSPGILFNAADSQTPIEQNVLTIRVQPDEGVSLRTEAKVPGHALQIQSVKMDFRFGSEFAGASPEAYERLLLDAMIGDATLFIRHDEAELSWKFFDPILNAWRNDSSKPVCPYAAGTWGPQEADQLLLDDGRNWRRL